MPFEIGTRVVVDGVEGVVVPHNAGAVMMGIRVAVQFDDGTFAMPFATEVTEA